MNPKGSNNRRQTEFHQTFRSIPEEEVLIDCTFPSGLKSNRIILLHLAYACALNREILIQGRLYVGEEHVCFYANILGWITSVVIAFRDIVSIEKRNTALIFPNAIQVATLHHRYFFASLMYREEAYRQLQIAWKRAMIDKVIV